MNNIKIKDLSRNDIYSICIKYRIGHQSITRLRRDDPEMTFDDMMTAIRNRPLKSRVTEELIGLYKLCLKYNLAYDSMAVRYRIHRSLAQLEDEMIVINNRKKVLAGFAEKYGIGTQEYEFARNITTKKKLDPDYDAERRGTGRSKPSKKQTMMNKWLSARI